jgi:hypothetical protein
MLERGEVLRTWALEEPPDAPGTIAASALADHRRAYLDYEGPVSGQRGTVTRWDEGDYELLAEEPRRLTAVLHGRRLVGRVVLTCQVEPTQPQQETQRWLFKFSGD